MVPLYENAISECYVTSGTAELHLKRQQSEEIELTVQTTNEPYRLHQFIVKLLHVSIAGVGGAAQQISHRPTILTEEAGQTGEARG